MSDDILAHFGVSDDALSTLSDSFALLELNPANRHSLYRGRDMSKDATLQRMYNERLAHAMTARLNEALDAKGDISVELTDEGNFVVQLDEVKHADIPAPELRFNRSRKGFIFRIDFVPSGELAHYGTKGMRWGIRKDNNHAVTVTDRPGRKRVKATGGVGYSASRDAKTAAKSKQIAKRNSTDALTNKQLQDLVKRMQLEKQFNDLASPKKGEGRKFVEQIMKQYGQDQYKMQSPKLTAALAKAFAKG